MGTNFFLRKKLNQEQKNQVICVVENDQYMDAREMLPENIHIGKRSCGWKFLWDVHFFYNYEPNIESLQNWLKSGIIIDEYGKEFSFDEFWNDELEGWLDKGYDSETYLKDHPEERVWWNISEEIKRFKRQCPDIRVNSSGEFYFDSLRCSIFEDFS